MTRLRFRIPWAPAAAAIAAAGSAWVCPSVAPADTVAYYRFEEGPAGGPASGAGSVLDSSGNGLHGTPFGGPVYRADVAADPLPGTGAPNDLSLEFDGNQRVFVPDDPRFELTQSLTVEAFIRPRPFPGVAGDVVFRGDERIGQDSFVLNLFQGLLRWVVIDGATGQESIVSTPAPAFDQWAHVAGTLDDATGVQALYVDGVLADSRVTTFRPLGPLDPASNPGIGIGHTQSGNFNQGFAGLIDEVRISDRALSPTEFIPEPSSLAWAGFAGLLLARRARRGRGRGAGQRSPCVRRGYDPRGSTGRRPGDAVPGPAA